MKKICIILLVLSLLMICACGAKETNNEKPVRADSSNTTEMSNDISVATADIDEKAVETPSAEEVLEEAEEPGNTGSIVDVIGEGTNDGEPLEEQVLALIDVQLFRTESEQVCVFITNNSETTIGDLTVQIYFYDESDNMIDVGKDAHDVVLPGYTVISSVKAPDNFAKYDSNIKIDIDAHSRYVNHSDNVTVKANQGDGCILLQITNDDTEEIEEIEYAIVLYREGEVVGVLGPKDVYHVDAGETTVEKVDIWKSTPKFDSFEVYLNQAHTF